MSFHFSVTTLSEVDGPQLMVVVHPLKSAIKDLINEAQVKWRDHTFGQIHIGFHFPFRWKLVGDRFLYIQVAKFQNLLFFRLYWESVKSRAGIACNWQGQIYSAIMTNALINMDKYRINGLEKCRLHFDGFCCRLHSDGLGKCRFTRVHCTHHHPTHQLCHIHLLWHQHDFYSPSSWQPSITTFYFQEPRYCYLYLNILHDIFFFRGPGLVRASWSGHVQVSDFHDFSNLIFSSI